MKPSLQYELTFTNFEQQEVKVTIYDRTILIDDSADAQIIDLPGAGDPVHIQTVDNSEDKFTVFKSKKATIRFRNDNNINYSTFATGEDDRFPVEITINDLFVFKGFLEQSDIQEPFLPQDEQEVQLIAIDGLAYLKDVALTDFNGETPRLRNRMIDYLAWCLSKTGNELNINVVNNLKEQDSPGIWQTTAQFTAPNTIAIPVTYFRFFKDGQLFSILGSGLNDGDYTVTGLTDLGFLGGLVTVAETIVNEAGGPTITFQDKTDAGNFYALYLDAKTFEAEIGTCENCEQVIKKILGRDCFITQSKGEWWIIRETELRNDFTTYLTRFDFEGNLISAFESINFEKAIGLQQLSGTTPVVFVGVPDAKGFFSQESTNRTFDRNQKFAKLTFNYDFPRETICNIDFSRGDLNTTVSPTDKHYDLTDWTLERNLPASASPTCTTYIRRQFNANDYETERYAVITNPSNTPSFEYIRSCFVPVQIKDKFEFAVDYKWSANNGSATITVTIAMILIYGDDGTFWNLDEDGKWSQSNASWSVNRKLIQSTWDMGDIDETEWRTLSVTADPIPVGGQLYVLLFAMNQQNSTTDDDVDIYYQNLIFDYIPYTNGSYRKYRGQSNTSTQTGNYKAKTDDTVYIADGPNPIVKGSILKKSGTSYVLAGNFYEGQQFLYPADGLLNLHPFGQIQSKAVFNQYRNGNEVLQAQVQGIDSVATSGGFADHMDIIHRYFNRDIEPGTNLQAFQLVSIDLDLYLCELKGTLIKTFDNNVGFVDTDEFEFKYIS